MRREKEHYTECGEYEYWYGYVCESCGYSHAESELVRG